MTFLVLLQNVTLLFVLLSKIIAKKTYRRILIKIDGVSRNGNINIRFLSADETKLTSVIMKQFCRTKLSLFICEQLH